MIEPFYFFDICNGILNSIIKFFRLTFFPVFFIFHISTKKPY